jgi:hypothetical protein
MLKLSISIGVWSIWQRFDKESYQSILSNHPVNMLHVNLATVPVITTFIIRCFVIPTWGFFMPCSRY